jgi:3-hydroxyacyl-CoA dehydrogenase/enoyl-CoA hydratase/3-hydroxybutyryl-CoA epimerase
MSDALPKNWLFHVDVEAIGWLTLCTEGSGPNVLGRRVIEELDGLVAHIADLAERKRLKGVVLMSGKPGGFIAGADIAEFDTLSDPALLRTALEDTHALLARIEALPVPMVMAIDGYCLGGGLELALSGHYRIATDSEATRIGFPEIRLGIFPGFGGTGRALRQAGALDALSIMLGGTLLRAAAARRMGLVDMLVKHKDQLRWAARKAVLEGRRSRPVAGWKRLLQLDAVRPLLANRMRRAAAMKARPEHFPAPKALIDLFEMKGRDWRTLLGGETEAFVPLLATPTARNLRRVFFLSEGLKKLGLRGKDAPVFRRVHVIGAGIMGGDIAAWCALRGFAVTLQDLDMERIKPALERAKGLFRKRLRGRAEQDRAVARLIADPEGRGVARADVIIEAVVEKLAIKRKIFEEAERRARPEAILASNTSSIPLEDIATAMKDPGRLIGLHFFNPVAQLPLVEVVEQKSGGAAVARGASFALAIGKSPVVVRSAPGFLVNRVLMPYLLGAVERLERGEAPERLDAAALAFGMPMGPIELMDVVGLDIGRSVAEELGTTIDSSSRFARLIAAGKLGRKTGEGFYRWVNGKALKAKTPVAREGLEALGRALLKPLADEAEKAVAEGIVDSPDLADIGTILGTGFAPFLGGPINARMEGRV